MTLTFWAAAWFLPFVAPLCLFVAFSDLSRMKIPTWSTDLLLVIFILVGLIALPFWTWAWQLLHFAIFLAAGIILNAARAMGAGDAKFIASAAPFCFQGDVRTILGLAAATLLAGVATHFIVKATPLRQAAAQLGQLGSGTRPLSHGLSACGFSGVLSCPWPCLRQLITQARWNRGYKARCDGPLSGGLCPRPSECPLRSPGPWATGHRAAP